MEIVSFLDPMAYIRYAATVQPKATVPVDLPCFGLCQSRNKTCPVNLSSCHYYFLMQTIACGSIRRSMFSGGVLNWKKLTKYPRSVYFSQSEHFATSLSRLLPEVVTAINFSCTTTFTKSSPTPPLNQSRHALPCEARLRSPENHSVL
ncbi:uncharacterized protein EAE97_011381 [Botrytis byssoidea]|uniref:Uncharacterized protein n=1 Tax=Botrytis byssoidea TaxID=139641 RepID=A0A9P5HRP3_9HELO|nr:uncharacterized protein EAE97_011381 [Botrytis byssoidea]KAF7921113.1 hypothetical protein EAE97_011381 [Botrytis byssoidea]